MILMSAFLSSKYFVIPPVSTLKFLGFFQGGDPNGVVEIFQIEGPIVSEDIPSYRKFLISHRMTGAQSWMMTFNAHKPPFFPIAKVADSPRFSDSQSC